MWNSHLFKTSPGFSARAISHLPHLPTWTHLLPTLKQVSHSCEVHTTANYSGCYRHEETKQLSSTKTV